MLRTKRHKQKKNKKQIMLPLFIIVIMTFSILGFTLIGSQNNQQREIFGKYSFTLNQQTQKWELKQGGETFEFLNLPKDVQKRIIKKGNELNK